MSDKIIEKLDAIEAANLAKVEEITSSVDAKLAETVAREYAESALLVNLLKSINELAHQQH